MFSQKGKSPEPQPKPQPTVRQSAPAPRPSSGEPSIISADLKVVGDLQCSGELQVKGNVEGDIKSRAITIGEGAHVQGSVMADTVHIAGSIKGQIEAPSVSVSRSARVVGDIVHQSLAVEAGAYLEGTCRRLDSKPAAGAVASLKTDVAGAGKKVAGAS